MMTSTPPALTALSFRLRAGLTFLICAGVGIFAVYWLIAHVLPIYGQLWRRASAIEVPYLAFGLLMAPPIMLSCSLAAAYAFWTGKKFNPPKKSGLARFETSMIKTSVYVLVLLAPLIAVITTVALNTLNYTSCPQLRKSGSAWQTYWVIHPGFCFKPDSYTENDWPCKQVDGKTLCINMDE
ncbi:MULTISPECIES: hypothetical protein [Pseudomonas]|uniref:Transmembrane protein n=1 Tax=Pseudomonas putida TaxID=303 RepID=A0A1B2F377_PSEPU|nr:MULTISPECIES: hypothetical protein [Pseudomonas]ANY86664.1 hypothetical protein IEC33019_1093 [Pseudomonas putida]MCL8308863.1 hypothetical protein [Pseudomonas putida]